MGIVVDILLVVFVALGTYAGARRGLIKALVNLIGLVAIAILSYTFRTPVADFLIYKLPFFKFFGSISGLTSINILIYNLIAFVIIFAVLYFILIAIIKITGFVDTLLKLTVIWVLPSKIGGAIVGFFEAWVYVFLALFIFSQFSFSNAYINDSTVGKFVLNNTPVVGTLLSDFKDAANDIYKSIDSSKNATLEELNLKILQIEISYGLVTKAQANELIDMDKLDVGNIMFGKENSIWSNI